MDYIKISLTPSITSLNVLKNLRVVSGRKLWDDKYVPWSNFWISNIAVVLKNCIQMRSNMNDVILKIFHRYIRQWQSAVGLRQRCLHKKEDQGVARLSVVHEQCDALSKVYRSISEVDHLCRHLCSTRHFSVVKRLQSYLWVHICILFRNTYFIT